MRDLNEYEVEQLAGGFLPNVVVEIIAVASAVDILYSAGKSFAEGYEANDKY